MKNDHSFRIFAATIAIAVISFDPPAVNAQGPNIGERAYIGEMRLFAFDFCPSGFKKADGETVKIVDNPNLTSLITTTYGGNGQTTVGLPDLRGRAAIGAGLGKYMKPVKLGQQGGSQFFTVDKEQMATHKHVATSAFRASSNEATQGAPADAALANWSTPTSGAVRGYNKLTTDVELVNDTVKTAVAPAGGQGPISKQSPFLGMTWCIAVEGVFPSRPAN